MFGIVEEIECYKDSKCPRPNYQSIKNEFALHVMTWSNFHQHLIIICRRSQAFMGIAPSHVVISGRDNISSQATLVHHASACRA